MGKALYAARAFQEGEIVVACKPESIDVGMRAVVSDPFGNQFALVDLSKGRYQTSEAHEII